MSKKRADRILSVLREAGKPLKVLEIIARCEKLSMPDMPGRTNLHALPKGILPFLLLENLNKTTNERLAERLSSDAEILFKYLTLRENAAPFSHLDTLDKYAIWAASEGLAESLYGRYGVVLMRLKRKGLVRERPPLQKGAWPSYESLHLTEWSLVKQ